MMYVQEFRMAAWNSLNGGDFGGRHAIGERCRSSAGDSRDDSTHDLADSSTDRQARSWLPLPAILTQVRQLNQLASVQYKVQKVVVIREQK
jgi:hypothetical protein